MRNNKIPASQKVAYQLYLKDEKASLARLMCVISLMLFLAFIVVDIWALSTAFHTAVIIRSVVVLSLIITYLTTYTRFFEKYYNYIISLMYIIAVSGIEAMIYISSSSDQAYETYFVGVILTLITLFTWTYLQLKIAVPLAILSILGYVYIEVIHRDLFVNARHSALITNVFFLGSSAVLGFIGQLMRDKYLFQNFLLHQSLQSSLKEKTVEAKDNAYLANHDALTDLPNRRLVTEQLERSLIEAQEKNKVLAILFLDLDGFKQVNDIYGHAVGDQVLISVARRLESAIREGDLLARLGGDEYLIGLMMEYESVQTIEKMADDFMRVIEQPMSIDGLKFKIGASIGIAAYPMHGNKISILLDIADKKMYQTKHADTQQELGESEPVVIFPRNKRRK